MYLKNKKEAEIDIVLEEVEMDEMWSFYHDKKHQIWLWWAVEHRTNTPIAFVFGTMTTILLTATKLIKTNL